MDDLKRSDDYDHEMKVWDAIIFDEGIVHRGSSLIHSYRIAMRYIHRPYLQKKKRTFDDNVHRFENNVHFLNNTGI